MTGNDTDKVMTKVDVRWRNIGPFRGGRSVAVAGSPSERLTFFTGSAGGVWKTANGGITWSNVSDGSFGTASIGALRVSDSHPNVVYVGTGEASLRNNISVGDGVYRSSDGGHTWTHVGLTETRHIPRLAIHPTNPDIVFAAAFGHAFGPNEERGVFRTVDGGKTWEKVLYRDEFSGAIDIAIDKSNPDVIFASLWQARRSPWHFSSGGPGSGLFRSTDGGTTWEELTGKHGLPTGLVGKTGVAVSPARTGRVWALMEAEGGGLFRSDDYGATWQLINGDREIQSRPWYYSHVHADPADGDTVYVLDTYMWRSRDGGEHFVGIGTPHCDHHDLWIDPADPLRMIHGADGGASVSFDGGASWSSVYNQPTAEIYRLAVDTDVPYRVYGSQQDNSTISVPSRTAGLNISMRDEEEVGGGESGDIAVRPDNSDIVYAGNVGGELTRYDRRSEHRAYISVWPERTQGLAAEHHTHRFNWTSPVHLSPHDPDVLYTCGNQVFRSADEGQSWEAISPDLTRNDPEKLQVSGGPITIDQTGAEVYCTIYSFGESPVQKGLLWAGTDDGLVQVSEDGGATWTDVTPEGMPEWAWVTMIEPSRHDAATAFVTATRYRLDDGNPYVFRTRDAGKTWDLIVDGLQEGDFARAVRHDPVEADLLYLGTERGLYVSFDGGESWRPCRGNLPVVPVHDMAVEQDDLVVATHGRGFWILDDVSPLRELAAREPDPGVHLFRPRDTVRFPAGSFPLYPKKHRGFPTIGVELPGGLSHWAAAPTKSRSGESPLFLDAGQNPPRGVIIHYTLSSRPDLLKLEVLDEEGRAVRTFQHGPENSASPADKALRKEPGAHRFIWDMNSEGPVPLKGATVIAWRRLAGPQVPPGMYTVRLTADHVLREASFRIAVHPRYPVAEEDLRANYAFLGELRDTLSAVNIAIQSVRDAAVQVEDFLARLDEEARRSLQSDAEAVLRELRSVETELIQVDATIPQDEKRFPPKLNAQLEHLLTTFVGTDAAPTAQARAAYDRLKVLVQAEFARLDELRRGRLSDLNERAREIGVPSVVMETNFQKHVK